MKWDLYIAGQKTWLSESDQKGHGTSPIFYLRGNTSPIEQTKRIMCVGWGGGGKE